jgi:putative transposase
MAADGRHYRIHQVIDLETVLVHDSQTGELQRLKIGDLTPATPQAEPSPPAGDVDLVGISDAAWQTAQERFAAIRPLLMLSISRCTRAQVAACARHAGVTTATLYRWLKLYQRSGRVSALIPAVSSGGRGQGRLSLEAEAIVQATIEEVYLSRQKPSVQQVCIEVLRRCRNAGVIPPHPNTVRSRIRHTATPLIPRSVYGNCARPADVSKQRDKSPSTKP